ncbi:hypothetical protein AR456_09115 [Halomonas huangheensis]|nr:hypothetical protein AR456_09115 [Halomonas huangheensis]
MIASKTVYTHSQESGTPTVTLSMAQSSSLHNHSLLMAAAGGPQKQGADIIAKASALELRQMMTPGQGDLIDAYAEGLLSYLVFDGMQNVNNSQPPSLLEPLEKAEISSDVLYLASRSQILLEVVRNRAFAYDIDNEGKIVRVVANYKGGGSESLEREPADIELSSHSGLELGPHTEAPYWCSFNSENGHSPAPSTLILSALWNPLKEPTTIIPIDSVLQSIGAINALALTSKSFKFTRSDSFVDEKGEDGNGVSILDYSASNGFAIRYNSYRFSVVEDAPIMIRDSYSKFISAMGSAQHEKIVLNQNTAVLINNYRSLHCRDVIKDNRRLLVRLFGYCMKAAPIVLNESPMIVKG